MNNRAQNTDGNFGRYCLKLLIKLYPQINTNRVFILLKILNPKIAQDAKKIFPIDVPNFSPIARENPLNELNDEWDNFGVIKKFLIQEKASGIVVFHT